MKTITLKASNGKFVCNEQNGAAPLIANRDAVGTWEQFDLEFLAGAYCYNAKDYGATGDASTDDAAAIQAAIDAADAAGGGAVYLPPGRYRVASSLELKEAVRLVGAGFSTNSTNKGSFIYFQTDLDGPAIEVLGRSATIEWLGVYCDQPEPDSGWAPNAYGNHFAIHIKCDDVTVRNVFLYNVTRGIAMANNGGSIGRVTLDRIYGQPLKTGIKVDNALDVVKITNVHFWPFWKLNEHIGSYMFNNATGLESYRSDNPFYSNIFCLIYREGMRFSRSENPGGAGVDPNIWGCTSKFKIVNADLDFCSAGLVVNGSNTTGQVANFSCQGTNAGDPSYEGISIAADGVRFQASNLHVTNYSSNGIRIGGNGTIAMLANTWINDWNNSGQGFPAIEAVDGGTTIYLSAQTFCENGNGAPNTGGQGTIHNG